jgi:hypothetical protein
MKATRKNYEAFLNGLFGFWEGYIGGKMRHGNYGSLLRRHDPIAFEVGFNEYRRAAQ